MAYESELSKFVQKFGSDYPATITMGQLQHLVNEKNAAEERIKELEARVERLQEIPYTKTREEFMKSWGVDGMPLSNIRLVNAAWDRAEWFYNQSLEAVKREAWEDGNHGQKAFWEGFERGCSSDNKNIRQHWEEWKEFKLSNLNS